MNCYGPTLPCILVYLLVINIKYWCDPGPRMFIYILYIYIIYICICVAHIYVFTGFLYDDCDFYITVTMLTFCPSCRLYQKLLSIRKQIQLFQLYMYLYCICVPDWVWMHDWRQKCPHSYNYEWAKRTKFLLAVIYGSACRHSIGSKTFKKNRKNVR